MPLHQPAVGNHCKKDQKSEKHSDLKAAEDRKSSKHAHHKQTKGNSGKKGKKSLIDDGSLDVTVAQPGDPNYIDEEEAKYILYSDSVIVDSVNNLNSEKASHLSFEEFKLKLSTIFEEYFLSEDINEAIRCIGELSCPSFHYEIVKRGINLSLDRKDHERELMSKLLSGSYSILLSSTEIAKGFERLFEMIDDIQLDAPAAKPLVSSFLARAVVDEILPPSFLSDPEVARLGGTIVDGARKLLSRDHILSRVERVWGPGDGRPVEELKIAIDQLVEEYLLSRQSDEAIQCIRELDCSHFHHEIIKRAIRHAIEGSDEDRTIMSSLLTDIRSQDVMSVSQLVMGFDRLYETLPDILLDVPNANQLLDKFVLQAKQDGCLPASYIPPIDS